MNEISVICPVYNGEEFVPETLDAILSQTFKRFQVYLVDDGSTDKSLEILRKYESRDDRITVIDQQNRGQAAAINRAIRASSEPLIALCDVDDIWHPDHLQLSHDALQADPDATFSCTDFSRAPTNEPPWPSIWNRPDYHPTESGAFDILLTENFVCRSTVLMRRQDVLRVDLFSEFIGGRCGCDDIDMWLKLSRNRRIVCLDKVLVWKRSWDGQGNTHVNFYRSKVRLWKQWKRELAHEPRQYRLADRNLVTAMDSLSWTYRQNREFERSLLTQLATLRYQIRPFHVGLMSLKLMLLRAASLIGLTTKKGKFA